MSVHLNVQARHLERGAYLYIRQSSMRQVLENTESAKRQYALRGRAIALGWREDQIVVIDNDQGESGASAVWREGFQRLVSDVGMGRAGIVMGLEVSRLARNNADWQRLLEICALADTLILDEDGIYDPASFNDRLLLGLKGTMSEAELHVIKARLRGGILNKARRGEYRCPLPTGLVYDHVGNVVLDPDMQVRETITHFFDTFARVGSASQTVKAFRASGLLFPSRLHNTQTVFRPLTASTAMRVLTNPRYAGPMPMADGNFGAPSTARRPCAHATTTTGSPASRTPIPATSPGCSTRRISASSRPMATVSAPHAGRSPGKARRCCRVGPSAGNAAPTSGSATPPGGVARKPGTTATAPTPIAASPHASRSPGRPSTRRWAD